MGTDTVVTCKSNKHRPVVVVARKRMTSKDIEMLGVDYVFIENKNIHSTDRRLRGMLVLAESCIGVIIKAIEDKCIYRQLLPTEEKDSQRILCLTSAMVRPLQQIHGPAITETFLRRGQRLIGGYVSMNPYGPDKKNVSTRGCNTTLLRKLEFYNTRNKQQTRKRVIKKLPLIVPTLYIQDEDDRMTLSEEERDKYWIPMGNLFGTKEG